jgi:membrane protein implicated in regulation of membrane protease activity
MAGFFLSLPAWPFYVALVAWLVLAGVAVHAFWTAPMADENLDNWRRG